MTSADIFNRFGTAPMAELHERDTLADGSIDVNTESACDRPGIAIDEIHHGDTRDCRT